MFDQGQRTAQRLLGEGPVYEHVIASLQELVDRQPPEGPPPAFYRQVYSLVSNAAADPDPFKRIKQQNTESALEIYPYLKKIVAQSPEPLETAARIAIAGNIIDHGANKSFDTEQELKKTLATKPQIMDYAKFKKAVGLANNILYLGDNAGETVYDRVLIETIDKPTTFCVRPEPIINDATMEDAVQAGLDQVATLMSSGSDMPGIQLETASAEFVDYFNSANVIISKGMGNFETLSDVKRPIFFLLKAKCDLVAEHIGVGIGDSVLYASNVP
ncbi:MAG: ARMT1-like domain-containing protein [Anaerolineales bacterium]|jgi:uncharacterized protein with ATP-grasp and redox domains